jgi:formylmethanofuran dehydrogenase subunit E
MESNKCYYCGKELPEVKLAYFSVGKLVCFSCIDKRKMRD